MDTIQRVASRFMTQPLRLRRDYGEVSAEHHHHGSYMSQQHLREMEDLLQGIISQVDDGEELADWAESKIAHAHQLLLDLHGFFQYRDSDEDSHEHVHHNMHPFLSRSASLNKTAGKAYLSQSIGSKEFNQKVKQGEASMLYCIIKESNTSKYYEMLINRVEKNGRFIYQLVTQYGRIGPRKRNSVKEFRTLKEAKAVLAKKENEKLRSGYTSAYGSQHRAVVTENGKTKSVKLPRGQYPIGLNTPTRGWKNVDVSSNVEDLKGMRDEITLTLNQLEEGVMPSKVLRTLKRVYETTSEFDSSTAKELRSRLRKPMKRLEGTNKRFIQCPKQTVKELKTLRNYITRQLAFIS